MKINRSLLYPSYLLLFTAIISGGTLFNSCKNQQKSNEYVATGDTIKDGEALVNMYCTNCHKLVPANTLTKDVWKFHTLPLMGTYIGVSNYGGIGYYKPKLDSGISLVNWQIIVSYYQKVAPKELPKATPPVKPVDDWAGFTLKTAAPVKYEALTTMVAADTASGKIYTADARDNSLTEWDASLTPKKIGVLPSPAVSASFFKDGSTNQALFSCIGQLEPIDFPNGRIIQVNEGSAKHEQKLVASELARPVQTLAGDFNKDGLTDWIILGQGAKSGAVYMMQQKADHSFTQSTVINKAGAVQAVVGDFNKDGWPDLMVLFGSGDEGIWMLLNDHKGNFTPKNIMQFPPVYGSTSIQLADLNHDGKLDIIYTCGYNYHDSRILKPYHGLYIFMNQGDWKFKQTYFYPIDGCTKAVAADFDGDGDLDIVTSAFFADLKNNPSQSVMYFEQGKDMAFKPHAIPVSKQGRWLSMDVADYNHDGKPDVLLGNYSVGYTIQPDLIPFWDKKAPFIILQNNMHK